MPLSGELRCPLVWFGSKRGPPGAAAQMWAAVPTLISPSPSELEPIVGWRHDGSEQSQPARFAIWFLVFSVNSSRFFFFAIGRGYSPHTKPERNKLPYRVAQGQTANTSRN